MIRYFTNTLYCLVFLALVQLSSKASAETTLSQGLIAHYKFESGWNDLTTNNRHLTPYSAAIKVNGRNGWDPEAGANQLSATADFSLTRGSAAGYLNTNASTQNLSSFTFATWFKANTLSRPYSEVSLGEWSYLLHGAFSIRLSVETNWNRNFVVVSENHVNGTSQLPLMENRWYHLTATHSESTTRLYLDGALLSAVGGEIQNPASLNPNSYELGNFVGFYNLDGEMDDVRIYDRALSSAEVTGLVPEPTTFQMLPFALGLIIFGRRART